MYNSTKEYIKRQILQLIEQCNDTEHKQGEVNINDIKICVNELNDEILYNKYTVIIKKENDIYIAECLEFELSVEANTYDEAKNNIKSIIKIYHNGDGMLTGYHDVEKYYRDKKEEIGNVLINYDDDSIWISDFGIFNVEELDQLINDLMKAKDKLEW